MQNTPHQTPSLKAQIQSAAIALSIGAGCVGFWGAVGWGGYRAFQAASSTKAAYVVVDKVTRHVQDSFKNGVAEVIFRSGPNLFVDILAPSASKRVRIFNHSALTRR